MSNHWMQHSANTSRKCTSTYPKVRSPYEIVSSSRGDSEAFDSASHRELETILTHKIVMYGYFLTSLLLKKYRVLKNSMRYTGLFSTLPKVNGFVFAIDTSYHIAYTFSYLNNLISYVML